MVAAVVAVLVVGVVVGVLVSNKGGGPTQGAGQVSLQWSAPVVINPNSNGAYTNEVSCPTTSFCMSVGSDGYAVAYNGTWGAPSQLTTFENLRWISCPAANACIASGQGDGQNTYYLTYQNGAWTQSKTIPSIYPGLGAYSCPTTTFCAGLTEGGPVAFNGSNWIQNTSSHVPAGASSCPSVNLCVGVEDNAMYTFNGTSWAGPVVIDPHIALPADGLSAVSCPTTTFCAAVDASGNALTYNGHTWTNPVSIDPNNSGLSLDSISCPTSTFCVAVDQAGNAFTFNGRDWSSANLIDPKAGIKGADIQSVSCPSPTFCVAIDLFGRVMVGK